LIVALALVPPRVRPARDRHPEADRLDRWQVLPRRREWLVVVGWCVVLACLPDVDFAWGRHNMETHSVGFALLVGLAVFALTRSARLATACTLAVATHVLFDWLGSDDSPPLGVTALWPLSDRFYFAEAYVFDAISRRYWLPGFIAHNAVAVLKEIAILAPPLAIVFLLRAKRLGWARRAL
jgi:membrane-bound metal-dependent hydrolase YbcI (DUF457 family)